MKLKKTIPARTVTFTASACKIDWVEMTPRFRAIRDAARNKMDKCGWCNHPFADGEKMSLEDPPGVLAEQKFTQPPARFNEGSLVRELEKRGIEVTERVPLQIGYTEQNAKYLETKRDRMGHLLS